MPLIQKYLKLEVRLTKKLQVVKIKNSWFLHLTPLNIHPSVKMSYQKVWRLENASSVYQNETIKNA